MANNLEFHGSSRTILHDPGELMTDRKGLVTCTAVFYIVVQNFHELPDLGAKHPIFGGLGMESRKLSLKGAHAIAECNYAGVTINGRPGVDPTITYELTVGLSEEPIETHPKFVTTLGGTPKNPGNGAIFRHAGTGALAYEGAPAPTDDGYVFDSFAPIYGGAQNPFAKVSAYLDSCAMTWRRTSVSPVSTSSVSKAGKIDTPSGNPPKLATGRNWLNMGVTQTQRGAAFVSSEEWRASGPNGWNADIYG